MSKRKTLKLHEWQKIARVESVRADIFDLGPWGDNLLSETVPVYFDKPVTIFVNEPAKRALAPYLSDDSGKTPDAS